MPVTIAGEEMELDADTCQNVLRGKMIPMGCLINSSTQAFMRAKKYPVLVKEEKLADFTTDAGKWEGVYTYVIRK